jgi:putative hydrolase of the HAD superfamily
MNPPEYLLLDVDGVLQFANETSEANLNQAYHWITGHEELVENIFSHPDFPSTQTGEKDFLPILESILPHHVHDLSATQYMEIWLNGNVLLNQELIARIPELPATYLATNQERHRGEFVESLYSPHVVDSFISCQMGASKPSAEFFQLILAALDTTPDNCVFVDDRRDNILVANQVGIRGILFQDNESLFSELNNMGLLL